MDFSGITVAREYLTKLAQVGTHQQETEWTCSAACARAALLHLGYDLPEADLAELIGAVKGRGAETTEIVSAMKKLGLESWEQGFSSLDEAREMLRRGVPIIADIQSFNYPGTGHYVLLAGFNDQGFKMMDPNTKGKTSVPNWRLIPNEKLEEIWWDRRMAPPHDMMSKWGVMITEPGAEKLADWRFPLGLGLMGGSLGYVAGEDTDPKRRILHAIAGALGGGAIGSAIGSGSPLRSIVTVMGPHALHGAIVGAEIGTIAPAESGDKRVQNAIDGGLLGAALGLLSGGHAVPTPDVFVDPNEMPRMFKDVKSKADAKRIYRELAKKMHPDMGGSTAEMQGLNNMWEQARLHPDFPKTAAAIADGLIDEMVKLGMSEEAVQAMVAGAKALGILGAGIGLVKGSDPGPDGQLSTTGPISGAVNGAIKGALVGALLALGLQRNAAGQSTIPRLF
jgi:hypothetical protein